MSHTLTLEEIAAACSAGGGDLLPMPSAAAGGGTFAEPWQAHAFALTLLLYEQGVFTWPQWAAALATEIQRAQEAGCIDDGSRYYEHWLDALELLIVHQQLATTQQIHDLEHAWGAAAERTPHGQPIELSAADTQHLR